MPDIPNPQFGDTLASAHPSEETVRLLSLRRSTTAAMLSEPGPSADELAKILALGSRVPDHRRVCPYRFVIFEGDARSEFGQVLASAFKHQNPESESSAIDLEAARFTRAPAVVVVVFSPQPEHRTPVWEQTLTVGAVCQTMLIAASALGFAAQWLTEWYAYDRHVLDKMGLTADEKIAGFIYLGSAREEPKERQRVDPETLVRRWQP